MSPLPALAASAVLLVLNGVFVAAEFATIAARRSRLDALAATGSRPATLAVHNSRHLTVVLAGCQLGITACSLGIGALAEPALAHVLEPRLTSWGLPGHSAPAVAFLVALTVVVFLHLVVGEMAPKSWAMGDPEPAALRLARPLWWYTKVTGPLIRALNAMGDALVRLVGVEPQGELAAAHSASDLLMLLRDDDAVSELGVDARSMLTKGLELTELRAVDAMTPRRDVVKVPAAASVADAAALMRSSGRSRLLVHGGDLDDVVGLVHVKDVLRMPAADRAATPVATVARDVPITYEYHRLEELLGEMRASRTHLAVVVDEHGTVSGIVTLEDILEELIGEFDDESDPLDAHVRPLDGGGFAVPGTLRPDELAAHCGVAVPDGDYETVAGFVMATLGRIPVAGDRVEVPTGTLVVTRLQRFAVVELEVHPAPPAD